MYCSGCGQALVAGQGFCPRCGQGNGLGVHPGPMSAGPGGVMPMAQLDRRVQALAVGWLVYAALIALTGMAGLAFAHAWMGGHMGDFGPWVGHGWGRPLGMRMPLFWLKFSWIGLGFRVGLTVAAGLGLMQRASWGRWVAIVAAVFSLFHFPFGTGLGIWTLVVLAGAPNAAGYEVLARE